MYVKIITITTHNKKAFIHFFTESLNKKLKIYFINLTVFDALDFIAATLSTLLQYFLSSHE